jgi:hypothetical protein
VGIVVVTVALAVVAAWFDVVGNMIDDAVDLAGVMV